MKKAIPYIIALVLGLFARSWISAANGWSYTMSGVDLLNALASAGVVYGFKGTFLPAKSKGKEGRR